MKAELEKKQYAAGCNMYKRNRIAWVQLWIWEMKGFEGGGWEDAPLCRVQRVGKLFAHIFQLSS